jgi:hypothetical protein
MTPAEETKYIEDWTKTQNALKINLMGIGRDEMISFANYVSEQDNKKLIEILTAKDSNNAGKILLALEHLNNKP